VPNSQKNEEPLVSVVVPTYNSSKTVLETLDSILAQTYSNLEVLIGDDASTDETIELCQDWLDRHSKRFLRAELLRNPENLGIVGNLDRLYRECRGQWIKPIAGDDLLLPDCIRLNVSFIQRSNAIPPRVVFSGVKIISQEGKFLHLYNRGFLMLEGASHQRQFRLFLRKGCFVPAPSVFLCTETLRKVGFLDREFRFVEDFSLWMKMHHNGVQLSAFDEVTVAYRLGMGVSSGVMHSSMLINTKIDSETTKIHKKYIQPFVHLACILYWIHIGLRRLQRQIALTIFSNKRNTLSEFVVKSVMALSPLAILNRIENRIG
jgi:glycosyltransferase involved in cell wall biosynthesis